MKLPVFDLVIDENVTDETKVDFVALVDDPAIERQFQMFGKDAKRFEFKADNERRIISGYLMIADLPIFRKDNERGEYFVKFSGETIQKIVYKFMKSGFQNNVNLMHDKAKKVEGAYMFESIVLDKSRGITAPKGFEDAPDGSWFASFKVDNDGVWGDIKEGKYQGFSVEGVFDHVLIGEQTDKQIKKEINKIQNMSEQKSFLQNILGDEAFAKLKAMFVTEHKFKDAKLKDGNIIRYDGDTPAQGMAVVLITEQGEVAVPDGEIAMEDGTILTISGSKIAEVKPAEQPKTEDEKPMENAEQKYEAKFTELGTAISALTQKIQGFEAAVTKIGELEKTFGEFKTNFDNITNASKGYEQKINDIKTAMSGLFEAVEKIGGEPSDKKTPVNPEDKKKEEKFKSMTPEERMQKWREDNGML